MARAELHDALLRLNFHPLEVRDRCLLMSTDAMVHPMPPW